MPSKRQPRLTLKLLGDMCIELDGAPLAGKLYGKLRALLAFLAVENDRSHSREYLAELFWPTLTPDAARTNLRQSIYNLRRALGDSATLVISGRESVRLGMPDLVWLDTRALSPIPHCTEPDVQKTCSACLDQMEQSAALWRGEFLADLMIEDAPGFDEWRAGWREHFHRQMLVLLDRLRICHEADGHLDQALSHAQHYSAIAPWDENGHRAVMRLLARKGQRNIALAHYEACRLMLEKELKISPEPATQSLFERIRDGAMPGDTEATASVPITTPTWERRQVTVLHCCLTIPAAYDAEEVVERLARPYQQCAEIARNLGAHIIGSTNGTLVAYFGYPAAFEDAARRAVRSALAIHTVVREPGVILRTGIHTDIIVTGKHADSPDSAGVASKVALRLSDRAGPDAVLISDATRRLVDGYFHLHALGPQLLAESLRPIAAFQVTGETGASNRLDTAPLLPLIGRKVELDTLETLAQAAQAGRCQCVVLRGEAGIGKSRLLRSLRSCLTASGWSVRELQCAPEHIHTPLYPVIAMIERLLAYGPDDLPRDKRSMMSAYLATWHKHLHDKAYPLLSTLLSISDVTAAVPPEQLKQMTISLLLELLQDVAVQQPLLLAVEDLHWADPATLALLETITQQCTQLPLLLVYTSRMEYALPAWLSSHALLLDIPHFDNEAMTALVLEAEADLPPDTVMKIVERADGIPLFAEELAHLAAEQTGSPFDVPSTLGYLLATRLDAIAQERRVAQIAATIGRNFDLDLLAQATGVASSRLINALERLQEARLISALDNKCYQFRHALMQEAAYLSQTKLDRQAAHRSVAEAINLHFPQRATNEPAEIARHLTSAGLLAEAIPWRLAIGQRALRAGAYTEAAEHLRAGIAAITALPTSQQNTIELDLLLPLGHTLLALSGYGSAEAAAVFDRAYALCDEHQSDVRRFEILWGLWMVSSSRPDAGFATSAALVEEMLPLARKAGEDIWLAHAYAGAANVALWQGRISEACAHAEAAIQTARAASNGKTIDTHDPEVAGWSYLSWGHCALGKTDAALAAAERAINRARTLNHPDSLCFALVHAASTRRMIKDVASVHALASEALALATAHKLPLWQGAGAMLLGWVQARSGQAEGIATLKASVAAAYSVMPGTVVAFLHPLAEAYGFLGDPSAQLATVEEAIAVAIRVGDYFHRADLYRIKSESLRSLGRLEEAKLVEKAALTLLAPGPKETV